MANRKKENVRDKYLIKALVCDMFSPSAVNLSLRQFEMKLEDSAKLNVFLPLYDVFSQLDGYVLFRIHILNYLLVPTIQTMTFWLIRNFFH